MLRINVSKWKIVPLVIQIIYAKINALLNEKSIKNVPQMISAAMIWNANKILVYRNQIKIKIAKQKGAKKVFFVTKARTKVFVKLELKMAKNVI